MSLSLSVSPSFKAVNQPLLCLENARIQEDAAGPDLPDLKHDAAQFCALVRHLAHLLLRVRGSPLGHCQTG